MIKSLLGVFFFSFTNGLNLVPNNMDHKFSSFESEEKIIKNNPNKLSQLDYYTNWEEYNYDNIQSGLTTRININLINEYYLPIYDDFYNLLIDLDFGLSGTNYGTLPEYLSVIALGTRVSIDGVITNDLPFGYRYYLGTFYCVYMTYENGAYNYEPIFSYSSGGIKVYDTRSFVFELDYDLIYQHISPNVIFSPTYLVCQKLYGFFDMVFGNKSFKSQNVDLSSTNFNTYLSNFVYENTFFTGSSGGSKILFYGNFYLNGNFYNKINIQTITSYGTKWVKKKSTTYYSDDINSTFGNSNFSYYYIMYVSYQNSINNDELVAVSPQYGSIDNGANTFLISDSLNFLNSEFAKIKVIFPSLTKKSNCPMVSDSYSWNSLNTKITNMSGDNYSYGGTSDALSLISTAYTAVIPLLSIAILPGLTVGTLIFLPIVATIIVIVFRMIKK